MFASLRKITGYSAAVGLFVVAAPSIAFAATGKFAGGVFVEAMCDIFGLVEGDMGALLAATGGLIAICGAAFGNLRGTPSFVVTAIGAFTISAGVSYGFGSFDCAGTAPAAPGGRTAVSRDAGLEISDTTPVAEVSKLPVFGTNETEAPAIEASVEEESSDDPFESF